jgi:hypothetical protein
MKPESMNLERCGANQSLQRKGNRKRDQARFIPIALTNACSRRATRAADAERYAGQDDEPVPQI